MMRFYRRRLFRSLLGYLQRTHGDDWNLTSSVRLATSVPYRLGRISGYVGGIEDWKQSDRYLTFLPKYQNETS